MKNGTKKLKFKVHKAGGTPPGDGKQTRQAEKAGEKEEEVFRRAKRNINHVKRHTKSNDKKIDEKIVEWGPFINGYQFVGHENSEKYFVKRHKLINEDEFTNSFDWSYLKQPEFVSSVEDEIEKRYLNDDNDSSMKYWENWRIIKEQGLKDVIFFPILNKNSEISLENIENFYKQSEIDTKTSIKQLLKVERIKWHPDKMAQTLKLSELDDEEILVKITKVFQIVNELYEKY